MPGIGRVRQVGETTIVELDGDADLAALPQLSQLLSSALSTATVAVAIDLDGLTLLDDAALGLITGAAAAARRRGLAFRLVCTDERRRARLAETRLDEIIDVTNSTATNTSSTDTSSTNTSSTDTSSTNIDTTELAGPYTAVIFSNRRTPDDDEGYAAMAVHMETLAAEQPGYVGIDSVRADDGAGITVSYWVDHAAARTWKRQLDHRGAQALGQSRWYDEYRVRIATVEHEYHFVRPIFHLALPGDWAEAARTGTYSMSTRSITIDEEGFVHCSFFHQLTGVANRFYGDLAELIVLHLDRTALDDRLRLEPPAEGIDELFPHLYCPITTDAVTATTLWRRDGEVWRDPPVRADTSTG